MSLVCIECVTLDLRNNPIKYDGHYCTVKLRYPPDEFFNNVTTIKETKFDNWSLYAMIDRCKTYISAYRLNGLDTTLCVNVTLERQDKEILFATSIVLIEKFTLVLDHVDYKCKMDNIKSDYDETLSF